MDIENHSTPSSDFLVSPMETMMQVGLGLSIGQQMARNISDYVFACNKQQMLRVPFIPPSESTEHLYFVAQKTTYIGPFPINEILRKMGDGTITTETLIWRKGLPSWIKLKDCSEISATFLPPPLPPQ